ncbi:MAG: type III pantothenate kinase [Thermodesulfobacteriota bacterium]|nr:type III pantothenate kinase [Thermodesulfobacteriota bacterium]
MLLAIDAGNSNILMGVFKGDTLAHEWRLVTETEKTVDEYGILFQNLYRSVHLAIEDTEDIIISCVVPPLLSTFDELCTKYFRRNPLIVGPGVKTGIPIHYDNPREVGADRIVNAVAAYDAYQRSLIVVDFGTATTFDCISPQGEYLGGAIAPGIMISSEALFHKASKLPRVEFVRPETVIGKNTTTSMQAGIIFGYVGLIDGIVNRMKKEMGNDPLVVATGGLAPLIAPESETIAEVDEYLTLKGLHIIYKKNKQ